jgi:CRISPR-associated endonuclease/helicase Cas3
MPLSFEVAFEALTGWPPFKWQRRLYDRFVGGEVPDALDLPTGLGKTSVMEIWLLARAENPSLPRRLVYVVDRRAVVDQATELAEQIRRSLAGNAVLGPVVKALGLGEKELPVSTLRGQFADNRRWLESPAAPAVIVGTIDMIGSRLLFEGYGVSRRMRPVHAALLGADVLLALDEAHLAPPFEALARRIADDSQGRPKPAPAFRLIALSATGRDRQGSSIFRLEPEDAEDAPVAARLSASKRLKLENVEAGKLVDALASRALSLGDGGRRVVVFCNSRRVAQAVENKLASERRAEPRTALLVGGRRGRERDDLKKHPVFRQFLPMSGLETETPQRAGPTFLVATFGGRGGGRP